MKPIIELLTPDFKLSFSYFDGRSCTFEVLSEYANENQYMQVLYKENDMLITYSLSNQQCGVLYKGYSLYYGYVQPQFVSSIGYPDDIETSKPDGEFLPDPLLIVQFLGLGFSVALPLFVAVFGFKRIIEFVRNA